MLVFNTAASFTTNTNLQHYSGEVSMSYFSQLGGLMWLQFVSAATGIAALAALARGIAGRPRPRPLPCGCAARKLPRALAGRPGCGLSDGAWRHADDAAGGCRGHHARRRRADHRTWSGRCVPDDQAARHQWRRLLRPERDPSARESQLLDKRARDDRDHPRAHGLRLDVRPHPRSEASCGVSCLR